MYRPFRQGWSRVNTSTQRDYEWNDYDLPSTSISNTLPQSTNVRYQMVADEDLRTAEQNPITDRLPLGDMFGTEIITFLNTYGSMDKSVLIFPKLGPIFVRALRSVAVRFNLAVYYIGEKLSRTVAICRSKHLKDPSLADAGSVDDSGDEVDHMDTAQLKAAINTTIRRNIRKKLKPSRKLYVPPARRQVLEDIQEQVPNESFKELEERQATEDTSTPITEPGQILEKSARDVPNEKCYLNIDTPEFVYNPKFISENEVNIEGGNQEKPPQESIVLATSEVIVEELSKNEADQSNDLLKTKCKQSSCKILPSMVGAPEFIPESHRKIDDLVSTSKESSHVHAPDFVPRMYRENPECNQYYNVPCMLTEVDDFTPTNSLIQTEYEYSMKPYNDFYSKTIGLSTTPEEVQQKLPLLQITEPNSLYTALTLKLENIISATSIAEEIVEDVVTAATAFHSNASYCSSDSALRNASNEPSLSSLFSLTSLHTEEEGIKPGENNDTVVIHIDGTETSRSTFPVKTHPAEVTMAKSPLQNSEKMVDIKKDGGEKKSERFKQDLDNERAELKRAIENINRKTKTLIKHVDIDDTLKIGDQEGAYELKVDRSYVLNKNATKRQTKASNSTDWDDIFDDGGELNPIYKRKIEHFMGTNVRIIKAAQDYTAYQNEPNRDLSHMIELYDFPNSFVTKDIIQIYNIIHKDPIYVKWVDDTHALLVLSSASQALRALEISNELIKSRPMCEASPISNLIARRCELKPATHRPQTTMQTARRLINTHLGRKAGMSKDQREEERLQLEAAREQRRQDRQNAEDAWEGRIKSKTSS